MRVVERFSFPGKKIINKGASTTYGNFIAVILRHLIGYLYVLERGPVIPTDLSTVKPIGQFDKTRVVAFSDILSHFCKSCICRTVYFSYIT